MKKTILLMICVLIATSNIKAQTSNDESLEGLKGIRLIVQLGRADAIESEQRPVLLRQLQKDAEAKFTKAGIPILKFAQDIENEPGSPTFHVLVTLDKPNGYTYPVRTDLKLFQKVRLSRKFSVELSVSTWESWGVGVYDIKDLNQIGSDVGRQIDSFIKQYLLANPK